MKKYRNFSRWTSVDFRKKTRRGFMFRDGSWYLVEEADGKRREKPVNENKVPGWVLDEAREAPLLGA